MIFQNNNGVAIFWSNQWQINGTSFRTIKNYKESTCNEKEYIIL